ncbi:MAG TPA: ribosomal protein S18-alanine N-acetyltransferase [Elusimicrobiota bacterium]|nr:ribosomal protein S18-alanine N-acetyltransferase [Elusimicrobiota bacterium]
MAISDRRLTCVFDGLAASDVPALAEIEKLSSPSPWTSAQIEVELKKPVSCFLTAREEGRPVGFGGFWLVEGEAQLATLAVHPSRRRRGIGGELLRRLCGAARDRGARFMSLEVRVGNAAALRLYGAQGFVETSRRPAFYEGKETAVLMEKKL